MAEESSRSATKLSDHKRHGSRLVPPLATTPKFQNASWLDERLPEMLWAALLITGLERESALDIFRKLARWIGSHNAAKQFGDITHSGISRLRAADAHAVISVIAADDQTRHALQPLMLFQALPARQHWARELGSDCDADRANDLMTAVGRTLWHQTQEATDCRWVRIICEMQSGSFHVPEELASKILHYPNEGDMRSVRPTIRAMEIGMQFPMFERSRDWAHNFWQECFAASPCMVRVREEVAEAPRLGTTMNNVNRVRALLGAHWESTAGGSGIDAEHDALFGAALYSLALLEELLTGPSSNGISGRLILRTILECYVTMSYLVAKRDSNLWQAYRSYGAGQAKLAYLKLQELGGDPNSIDSDTLRDLANEDFWEEFVSIELGNWGKRNLRDISIDAGVKDEYDMFYPWTSTFAHSQWCAVRDAVFDTCMNPLHRLHRIPRPLARRLGGVVPDASLVADRLLDLLSNRYPNFRHRVTIFYL
jgi:hypothetical protein